MYPRFVQIVGKEKSYLDISTYMGTNKFQEFGLVHGIFYIFLIVNTKAQLMKPSSQKSTCVHTRAMVITKITFWENSVSDGTEGILRIKMCRFDLCTHTHVILVHCCLTRGGGPNKSLYLYFCNGAEALLFMDIQHWEEK